MYKDFLQIFEELSFSVGPENALVLFSISTFCKYIQNEKFQDIFQSLQNSLKNKDELTTFFSKSIVICEPKTFQEKHLEELEKHLEELEEHLEELEEHLKDLYDFLQDLSKFSEINQCK